MRRINIKKIAIGIFLILAASGFYLVVRSKPNSRILKSEIASSQENRVTSVRDRVDSKFSNLKPLSSERKIDSTLTAIRNLQFAVDSEDLKTQLREEISGALLFPEPDRSKILTTLMRGILRQLASDPKNIDRFVEGLGIIESILNEFRSDIPREDITYMVLSDAISDLPSSDSFWGEKLEGKLAQEFSERPTDFWRMAFAASAVSRLEVENHESFEHLEEIDDEPLRIEMERAIIGYNLRQNKTNSLRDLSFYLGPKSKLGVENHTLVSIVSASFATFPNQVSDIVAASAPGDKRDAVIFQMVIRMGKGDPEATLDWIEMISNPQIKQDSLERFLSNLPLSQLHLPPPSGVPDPFADH